MRRVLLALGIALLLGMVGIAVVAGSSGGGGGDLGAYALFGPPSIPEATVEERAELRRYGRLAYVWHGVWTMNADGTDRRRISRVEARPPLRWSPGGTRLLFSDGHDLYTVRAGGSRLTRLTHGASNNVQPAWSPDGTRIAFASDRTRDYELYVMRADGSRVRRLTRRHGVDHDPVWSPDGRSIAFEASTGGRSDSAGRIDVVDVATARRQTLVDSAFDPAWSRDGERIAVIGPSNQVYVVEKDDGELTAVTSSAVSATAGRPVWSPADDRFAYSDGSIMVADGDGDDAEFVAGDRSFAPVWSPDGEKLLFLYAGTDGRLTLYAWPFDEANGYDFRRLTEPFRIDGSPRDGDLLAWEPRTQ